VEFGLMYYSMITTIVSIHIHIGFIMIVNVNANFNFAFMLCYPMSDLLVN